MGSKRTLHVVMVQTVSLTKPLNLRHLSGPSPLNEFGQSFIISLSPNSFKVIRTDIIGVEFVNSPNG